MKFLEEIQAWRETVRALVRIVTYEWRVYSYLRIREQYICKAVRAAL